MHTRTAWLLSLILLASCTAAPEAFPQPSPVVLPSDTPLPGPTVQPTAQIDSYVYEQNRRLGRGINLGNALEAPQEGEWGLTLQEKTFQIIKDGGFDSVRVPIRWSAHALKEAPYTIDEAFFKRIDWVVEQAARRDLAVILNIHHYEEIMASPAEHKERFLAIWDQIAKRYQDAPESVYFELLNEPNGAISPAKIWNQFAGDAIAAIRKTNPNRTLIVGPGDWHTIQRLKDLQLPEDDRNIIVTFHFYAPFEFTHQGAEWVSGSDAWLGTGWTGSKMEEAALNRDLDLAAQWSEQNRRPLFMGEFGAYSKADSAARHRWTAFMARSAEERGFSWAYWEFAAGFGAYDPVKQAWVEPIYTALMP